MGVHRNVQMKQIIPLITSKHDSELILNILLAVLPIFPLIAGVQKDTKFVNKLLSHTIESKLPLLQREK